MTISTELKDSLQELDDIKKTKEKLKVIITEILLLKTRDVMDTKYEIN